VAGALELRLRRSSRGALADEKIEAVLRSARATIGMAMEPAERELVGRVAKRLLELRRERSESAKEVQVAVKQEPAVKPIGECVGLATAAVFHANVGDLRSYGSVRAAQKGFGINLTERSSGKDVGQLKITKRGSSRARRWLYLAVLRWIKADPIAKAWYSRKVARDGGTKMKALVALMRKLVAGLYHVARGERFDSSKLFDVRRLEMAA
jgi:transposase